MAMAISNRNGRISDINVTPMADVMIVLLIIFMVTIPLINEGPVRHLPAAAHARNQAEGKVVLSLAADATLYFDGKPLARAELPERLRQALEASKGRHVHLRADADLAYAAVAPILDVCRRAGAEEVAFIATPRTRS